MTKWYHHVFAFIWAPVFLALLGGGLFSFGWVLWTYPCLVPILLVGAIGAIGYCIAEEALK